MTRGLGVVTMFRNEGPGTLPRRLGGVHRGVDCFWLYDTGRRRVAIVVPGPWPTADNLLRRREIWDKKIVKYLKHKHPSAYRERWA